MSVLDLSQPFTFVETAEQVEPVLRRLLDEGSRGSAHGYDTETMDWDPGTSPVHKAVVVCFSVAGPDWSAVIDGQFLCLFKPWLESAKHRKITANLKFEMHVCANHYIELRGGWIDCVTASHTLAPHMYGHGMEDIGERLFKETKTRFKRVAPAGTWHAWMMDRELFIEYSRKDAMLERAAGLRLLEKLEKKPWVQWHLPERDLSMAAFMFRMRNPLDTVLYRMERRGAKVCQGTLERIRALAIVKKKETEYKLAVMLGGQRRRSLEKVLGSPTEMAQILFKERKLVPRKFTDTGTCAMCGFHLSVEDNDPNAVTACPKHPDAPVIPTPSTSSKAMVHLKQDPFVALVLEWRSLAMKERETTRLIEAINPVTGLVHTSYNSSGTKTSRLSASAPTLMNISKPDEDEEHDPLSVREAFICEASEDFIDHDYNQLELRLMASLCGDRKMVEGLRANEDFHSITAHAMFNLDGPIGKVKAFHKPLRDIAKNANFCLNYGGGAGTLSDTLSADGKNIVTVEQAKALIEKRKQGFPGLYRWWEQIVESAKKKGGVHTFLGFFRPTPDIYSQDDGLRARARNTILNTPVQGGAADVVGWAMMTIEGVEGFENPVADKLRELGYQMRLQVHDEISGTAPKETAEEALQLVSNIMDTSFPAKLTVPMKAEGARASNWAAAH